MLWWDSQFLLLLSNANIVVSLFKRYVDDADIMVFPIKANVQWDSERKCLVELDGGEDEEPLDKRTFRVLREIADSVTSMIKWSEEYPSAHESGKLPVLDVQMWCEYDGTSTRILHEFYMKPMANIVIIPATSAVS